ncbi:DUF4114 domain-containing protein [Desulfonema magnum]|nr:DUF4114 domain-containing protein [Desulfonema magnum]
MTSVKRNSVLSFVFILVMALSLFLITANSMAQVTPGDESKGHVTLNPGYIKGTVSIGNEDNNSVTVSSARIWAISKDASGNQLRSEVTIGSELGNYELTVHIPDETWKVNGTQEYTVYCRVYYKEGASKADLNFQSQVVSVSYQATSDLDFVLNGAWVHGNLETNCGLDYGWLYTRDSNNTCYTRIKFGADGNIHFPVRANTESTVQGTATMKNGWVYHLDEQSVNVGKGMVKQLDWRLWCDSGCSGEISGNMNLHGLGTNVLDRHKVYVTGATNRDVSLTSDGPYSLAELRPGDHQFYAQSWFNSDDDYFEYPQNFYAKINDLTCAGLTRDVSHTAAFINGKITFAKDATVVAFKDDQEGMDPPMASVRWASIYGHGIPNTPSAQGRSRDKINTADGRYDMILTDGKWNLYHTEVNFFHENIDLCGRGEERYLNSTLYINDHTRKDNGNEITLAKGQTVSNNDFTYETGSVTLKYYVNDGGTGTLKNPYLTATSHVKDEDGKTKTYTIANASGRPNVETSEGEVTFIGIPGKYVVQPKAIVNGASATFGEQVIYVIGGVCRVFEMGAPTLDVEGPAPGFHTCAENVTVSGKATDEKGVTAITVNGIPADFTPTDNPEDPEEVFFSITIDLKDGANSIETTVENADGKTASETRTVNGYTAGVFTVEESGEIRVDYLYDGGNYEPEIGLFSLSGMEELEPNSDAFIKEAVTRVMSDSENGHIILRDAEDGARFPDGYLGGSEESSRNIGDYTPVRKFEMHPGDRLAMVMIPDATFAEIDLDSAVTNDPRKRPIFSLASPNPGLGLYYGQIANVGDAGNAFVFEDNPAFNSDRDYNDIVVQVKGVTVCSPTLDGLIADGYMEQSDDWRVVENPLEEHIEVSEPTPETLWMTVTLKSPADLLVYDPRGNVIGKEGGYIPGATFEVDENGHQIVSLPALEEGEYKIVLRAIGHGGLCHLEVKGWQGKSELLAKEEPFVIEPHQVLTTTVSATAFVEEMTIDFAAPELPKAADGTPLAYDFNGDGSTDDEDIEKVSALWNLCEGDREYDAFFDLDDDGCISVLDIMPVANSKSLY